jgi:hypothetical protein
MDISNLQVSIQCPNCSFEVEVLLKQVIAEEVILCPSCTNEIQLIDENGSASRAQVELNEVLGNFGL